MAIHIRNATGRDLPRIIEIERLASQCRFADCRHLQEPDCAVRAAVAARQLSPRRYESFRRLQRLVRELTQRPGR